MPRQIDKTHSSEFVELQTQPFWGPCNDYEMAMRTNEKEKKNKEKKKWK